MEIRIRRRMTGARLRDHLIARYGDTERLRQQASKGDVQAQDAVWNLERFDEDPARLDQMTTIEDFLTVDADDLSRLTATRLHLVEVLKGLGEVSLKELTMAVGRDKKNVSRDIAILQSYGLVDARRHGKEKRLAVTAEELAFAF